MKIFNTAIKECRACYSKRLLDIISFGSLYLSDFVKKSKKPPKHPLSLVLCQNCSLLQLKHTTPPSLLYTDNYGYESGINQTMKDHLKEITEKSSNKLKNRKGKIIAVDIGANDGTLLKYYSKNVYKVAIEPIKKFAGKCKKYADVVINDFFNFESYNKYLPGKKADLITAISCFYDIDNPNKFLHDITKILNEDGIFIIQQNYLKSMLEQNAFDNIVHEHLEYYTLTSLQNLLKKHGLEVFDVELNNLNGGSFRTYICFNKKRPISKSVKNLLIAEKRLNLDKKTVYREFAKRVRDNKKTLKKFIKTEVKEGKKIYLYGASTRGNTLLQYFNLSKKLIPYAIERNPEKWGKKIASLGIPIISEDRARKDKPDYMLVLPWFFKDEFLKRESEYLKNGGHFIFPLPNLEII
ncbi:MAG: methyltransferase domain-containing protein [Patescibacteria group bacterium]